VKKNAWSCRTRQYPRLGSSRQPGFGATDSAYCLDHTNGLSRNGGRRNKPLVVSEAGSPVVVSSIGGSCVIVSAVSMGCPSRRGACEN
jgi:hypothetical protein